MEKYIIVACFIGFDILTGLVKAGKNGNLNSSVLRRGLYAKVSEILTVFGSSLMEYGFNYFHVANFPLVVGVVFYICLMEMISILENLAEINPHLKKLFGPYLYKARKLQEDIERENGKENEKENDKGGVEK